VIRISLAVQLGMLSCRTC